MTALFESFSLTIIHDVFSLPILTYLLFSWIRKPILDSGFPLISHFNTHIVVSPMDFKLCEILGLGFRDFVEDVWYQREGVGILHGHHIKLSVVLDQAWAPVLLLDEEDQGCHG